MEVDLVVLRSYTENKITYIQNVDSLTHQLWETIRILDLRTWKTDITFPEQRALTKNWGDATFIHWGLNNCFIGFLQILYSIYCLVIETRECHHEQTCCYDLVKKCCLKGVAKESPGKKGQIVMNVFIEELKKNDELTFTTINASLIRKWLD